MDKQIGDWLAELDDAGLRENTIVIYYSDHGGILPRAFFLIQREKQNIASFKRRFHASTQHDHDWAFRVRVQTQTLPNHQR